jgi:hypothetical protein
MQNWIHIPVLLTLERIKVGATTENITTIILQNIVKFKGLAEKQFASCCVSLGCDKDSMFYGPCISNTIQVKENIAPYFIGVHYMAH